MAPTDKSQKGKKTRSALSTYGSACTMANRQTMW